MGDRTLKTPDLGGEKTQELIKKTAAFFKVLGDETRVKILYLLSFEELCVSDISELLNISQSAISHQLRQLKLEGQVKARRDGKNMFYSLDDEHVVDVIKKAFLHVEHTFPN